ncbi:General control protein [Elasticomyces elasticus]|nr:General control protein [Elasticomyces elasticus]KAK5738757.1 General control protein [Elasticomyces elasticus]
MAILVASFRAQQMDLAALHTVIRYSPNRGLSAADTVTPFEDDDSTFKQSIINQFTWGNRTPTPFISVFSNHDHARLWALKMGTLVQLYKIDVSQLSAQQIYQLATVVRHFDIKLAEAAQQHRAGAYLILHNIPPAAIVGVEDQEAIESYIYGRDHPEAPTRWLPLSKPPSPTISYHQLTGFTTLADPLADSRLPRLPDSAPATTNNPFTTASQQQTWLPSPASARHPPQPTFSDFDLFQTAPTTTPAPQATPRRAPSLDSTLRPSFNSVEEAAYYTQGQLHSTTQTNYTTQRNIDRSTRPPVPLFHSNSTGNLDIQQVNSQQFQHDIAMMGGGVNVAYEGTFGDLSSAGDAMFGVDGHFGFDDLMNAHTNDFTAINSGNVHGVTVSPRDVFNNESIPPSTSFTNLTTPGSTYLETPDDDYQTSPLFTVDGLEAESGAHWQSLFPEYETSAGAPMMVRNPSSSSTNQIVVHPGGESLNRKRSSTTASPATFSPAMKHSDVAGVGARKRDKPLPPIVVDEHDTIALKRARNTAAARKSRAKKVLERDDLEGQIADLKAQVEYWKAQAQANGSLQDSSEE